MGRLAGLVVLAAVIAFCVAQDRGTSAGVGRYIAAHRAARDGREPPLTIDEVMGPANRAAVLEGSRWSGRVATIGLIAALVFRRRSLGVGGKADPTRSRRLKVETTRSGRG